MGTSPVYHLPDKKSDRLLGNGSVAGTIKTQFEYDANGNLTAHIDGNGNRIEQRFDALDRRRAVVYPDTTEHQTDYDEDDNVVLTQDNNGTIRRAEFDALGRRFRVDVDRSGVPVGIVVEGESFERCTYDALGRPLSEANDFATIDRRIDSLGKVFWESIELTSPAPASAMRTITREHDDLGAIQRLVYPDGRIIQYDRDALNRVVKIVNIAKGSAYPGSTLHSDPHDVLGIDYRGQRTGVLRCGNGFNTGYQYDAAGRVIEIKHRDAGGLPILTLQHLYDGVGNMRFRNDISATGASGERFEYDSIYRLTRIKPDVIAAFNPALFAPATGRPIDPIQPRQATINARLGSLAQDAANATFAYDSAANRIREQRPGLPAVNYLPNALNEYQSVGSVVFSYDRNGNLVSDGSRQYFYDSRNLLVRVVGGATGADVARYFHDSSGRRIAEVRGGHVVHLVLDGLNSLEEYENGTLRTQYIHQARTDAMCQIAQAGKEYWLQKDVLGSTRLLSDGTGTVAGGHSYDAFGGILADYTSFNRVCFAGRRFDREIGMYDLRAREFSPVFGRFLQRDPVLVGGGLNAYEYAWDNPLRFMDPLGAEPKEFAAPKFSQSADLLEQLYGFLKQPFKKLFVEESIIYTSEERTEAVKRLVAFSKEVQNKEEVFRAFSGGGKIGERWHIIARMNAKTSLGLTDVDWLFTLAANAPKDIENETMQMLSIMFLYAGAKPIWSLVNSLMYSVKHMSLLPITESYSWDPNYLGLNPFFYNLAGHVYQYGSEAEMNAIEGAWQLKYTGTSIEDFFLPAIESTP